MKSLALLTILSSFIIGITAAHGQRFGTSTGAPRGAVASGGNSSGSVQFGTTANQSRQGAGGSVTIQTAPARTVAPTTNVQILSVPPAATQRFAPPVFNGGRVFVAPPASLRHPSAAIIETTGPLHSPQRPHRPFGFHRYPGSVIIGTPYYSSTTVVTEVAPGVVREESRYGEQPMTESRTRSPGQLAPFDPTPQEVVDRMLRLAAVRPGDVIYDLGAGDGRVVTAAAKKFKVKAVGFEIDPGLVKLARENVRKQGLEHLVEIRQQDFLTADLSPASVVTLYLSFDGNLAVRSQLMSQLKPNTRVVSYTFDMAEWQPKVVENYRDAAGNHHMLYLWEIGGPLAFSDAWR